MTRRNYEWPYFALVLGLWCFTPGLRRILDWQAGGFSSIQILSLLPTLALVPLAFIALQPQRLARLSPALRFFAICWTIACTYALIVGFIGGSPAAAGYEYSQFMFPVVAGLWLASQGLSMAETLTRLTKITLVIAAVVGVYGVFQFVAPPAWDVAWVVNSDMESVGAPEPFAIRIFSTMNSQGPCADFLAIVVLLALSGAGFRAIVNWPIGLLASAALALTLVRSAWLALVAGVIAYVAFSPRRLIVAPAVLAFACITAFLVVSLPTLLGDQHDGSQIVDRLETLGDLDHDNSALDRKQEIAAAFAQAERNPLGAGLGNIGSATKLSRDDEEGTALDSGFLARFYELGFLGFALYLVTIVGSVWAILARLVRTTEMSLRERAALATAAAICITMLALEAAGDSYGGITGIYFWLALGIGLRALPAASVIKRVKPAVVRPATPRPGLA